ncbi:MAG: transglutaminase-like cysteine peptidase [Alphaproteobacteria bacterium]
MNIYTKAAVLAVAAIGSILAVPAAAQSPALFKTVEYRTSDLDALPKWKAVMQKIAKEQKSYADCAGGERGCGSKAIRAWQAMIRDQQGNSQIDQLKTVTRFVNQWRYRTDQYNYDQSDYWASPAEFFSRSGDCEDYAITKYVTLRQMGFAADQLRIAVVKDVIRDLAHAVLAVYTDDGVFILDNVNSEVRPQAQVTEYAPYYSVNEQARWAHAATSARIAPAAAASLFSKR